MSRLVSKLGGGYILFTVLHFFLFALGLAICGLYATDLQRDKEFNQGVDSRWVFAVVVGALSSVTCIIWAIPNFIGMSGLIAPIWNCIMFILSISLFGVFGKLFINADANGNGAVMRMKNAVWVDLASALLWLFAAIVSLVYWSRHRDLGRTRFTGRARV